MTGPTVANFSTSALSDGQNLMSLGFNLLDPMTLIPFAEVYVDFREEDRGTACFKTQDCPGSDPTPAPSYVNFTI